MNAVIAIIVAAMTAMPHGLPGGLDAYHASLLTVLIAAWLAWYVLGAWAERRRIPWTTGRRGSEVAIIHVLGVPCCLIVIALVAGQPYTALYLVQWLGFALLGVHVTRWRLRHAL